MVAGIQVSYPPVGDQADIHLGGPGKPFDRDYFKNRLFDLPQAQRNLLLQVSYGYRYHFLPRDS